MGRKIPGKKHRKVVDPEKQRTKRLESLKNKINNPPPNPNEQEVPRSLRTIIALKNQVKENSFKKNNKKKSKNKKNKLLNIEQFLDKDEFQEGMKKPDKFIPNLMQKPQETPEGFLSRVNKVTQKIIKESQFEKKFGVSIKKDLKTGQVLGIEKDKEIVTRKRGRESKKKSLTQKRKEKKHMKENTNNAKDFSHLQDFVEFGEVVHKPPQNLPSVKKSKIMKLDNEQKGRYKSLLLQEIVGERADNESSKDKFKLQREERQRKFIVDAYRQRKKQLKGTK